MTFRKHLFSTVVGGLAAVAFMLSCDDGGDPGSTADAGEADSAIPSACIGECVVTGPITLAGQPVRMKTADTDPRQLVGGVVVPPSTGMLLAAGPLVVTDLSAPDTFDLRDQTFRAGIYVSEGDECARPSGLPMATVVHSPTRATDIHGARLLVPAGSVLCASQIGEGSILVSWSGFRPYE